MDYNWISILFRYLSNADEKAHMSTLIHSKTLKKLSLGKWRFLIKYLGNKLLSIGRSHTFIQVKRSDSKGDLSCRPQFIRANLISVGPMPLECPDHYVFPFEITE